MVPEYVHKHHYFLAIHLDMIHVRALISHGFRQEMCSMHDCTMNPWFSKCRSIQKTTIRSCQVSSIMLAR